jgi:ribonuclease P/MRP protein subunit RPP1
MKFTDSCIHPYPSGDSSLRRMALEAEELGFDSCVIVNNSHHLGVDINLLKGYVITGTSLKDVVTSSRRIPKWSDLVYINARDSSFNRAVLSLNGIHVLRNIGKEPNHTVDHLTARLAAEHCIALDIDLHPIIHSRNEMRQQVLQHYEDLIQLHRSFNFPLTISTNAHSILDQRSIREVILLCSLFGMERHEVYSALATPGNILAQKKVVDVIG